MVWLSASIELAMITIGVETMKLFILCMILLMASLSCASPIQDRSVTMKEYQGKLIAISNNHGYSQITYIYLDGQEVIPVVTNIDLRVGKEYKLMVVYDRNQYKAPYGEVLKIEELKP